VPVARSDYTTTIIHGRRKGVLLMRGDDRAESADDRDGSVVNAIFTAGMILHAQVARIEDGKAVHYVEGALEQLDEALREIRWAALVRRRETDA
jgi:hypothetical protein